MIDRDRMIAQIGKPSMLERHAAMFPDAGPDTRGYLMAGGSPDALEALFRDAFQRGAPVTDADLEKALGGPLFRAPPGAFD